MRLLLSLAASILLLTAPNMPQDVPIRVSLIQLIATPERYDGKAVIVIGYLRLEFEGDILYLGEQDYAHGITRNGVWVERTPAMVKNIEAIDSNFVIISGVFSAGFKGHRDLASGSIVDIRHCELWSRTDNPRNRVSPRTNPKQ